MISFHLGYVHFEKLKLLNVYSRVNYITLCHTYNIINRKCAKYLEELVVKTTHIPECSINSSSRHSKLLPHVFRLKLSNL